MSKEKVVLTPKDFAEQMYRLREIHSHDPEAFHLSADELFITVLRQQGFTAGCRVFQRTKKYYAFLPDKRNASRKVKI